MRPSRRSNSSVSAYSRSGSAPGSSATSASIAATRPGSRETSARSAGFVITCSSCSAESGTNDSARSEEVREPAIAEGPIVEVRPQRHDHPQAAVRIAHRRLEAAEEVPAGILVVDEGEDLLELVDHEHEL